VRLIFFYKMTVAESLGRGLGGLNLEMLTWTLLGRIVEVNAFISGSTD
jgi:hypothetical protein